MNFNASANIVPFSTVNDAGSAHEFNSVLMRDPQIARHIRALGAFRLGHLRFDIVDAVGDDGLTKTISMTGARITSEAVLHIDYTHAFEFKGGILKAHGDLAYNDGSAQRLAQVLSDWVTTQVDTDFRYFGIERHYRNLIGGATGAHLRIVR